MTEKKHLIGNLFVEAEWKSEDVREYRIVDVGTNSEIAYFSDSFSYDCPEDLIWGRMVGELIESVAKAAFEDGKRIGKAS